MKKLIVLRRFSQTVFSALFIYILWSTTYPLKGLLPPQTFFKIDPLIIFFTSISERIILPGMLFAFLTLVLTLIFGRFFCGWICPLGTAVDAVGALRRNRTGQKDSTNKKLRSIKFYILGLVGLLSLFGIQLAWVFDPMVIMARFVSLNLIPSVTSVVNTLFIALIKNLHLYGFVYDFYRGLKSSFLGINVYYFSHSGFIFLLFLFICSMALLIKRFWCRALCPLGALYALVARFSFLRRTIIEKCTRCLVCKSGCRMGAIKDDSNYITAECILCMDCVYDCPAHITKFNWPSFKRNSKARGPLHGDNRAGLSRREFIFLVLSSIFLLGFKGRERGGKIGHRSVIRPPAALREEDFLDRCIRCGNCMKVCVTNGLQPVMFQSGLEGIWTPHLVPEIGYCEYNCTLCGKVCPTGAIAPISLEEKHNVTLGLAHIALSICIPWAKNEQCVTCEEHCPVPEKAIKLVGQAMDGKIILRPYVHEGLCVGCGTCQNKCPVRPERAIRVT